MLCEGQLSRKGTVVSNKRYYVLYAKAFITFEVQGGKPKIIQRLASTSVTVAKLKDKVFSVAIGADEAIVFTADSVESKNNWLDAFSSIQGAKIV